MATFAECGWLRCVDPILMKALHMECKHGEWNEIIWNNNIWPLEKSGMLRCQSSGAIINLQLDCKKRMDISAYDLKCGSLKSYSELSNSLGFKISSNGKHK